MTISKVQQQGIKRIISAVGYSIKGFKGAWRHEAAFRQETVLCSIGIIITFFLPLSPLEKLALVASLLLVLIVELLNSAIEMVVDRVGKERHPLSAMAKDMGSAAVFLCLCLSALVWICILFV